MPFVSGSIQQIQARALDAPDQYDNTHKLALKINDTYYDFGGAKGERFSVKKGQNWVDLDVGDEVEFQYTTRDYNGKTYFNAKRSQVTLVAKGSGKAPEAPTPKPATGAASHAPPASVTAPRASSGGTDWARKDAGAAASASIDKAIRYFGIVGFPEVNPPHGDFNRNMEAILNVARHMNRLTTTLLEEILTGPPKAVETPAPVSKAETSVPKPAARAPAKKAAPRDTMASVGENRWEDEELDEAPF